MLESGNGRPLFEKCVLRGLSRAGAEWRRRGGYSRGAVVGGAAWFVRGLGGRSGAVPSVLAGGGQPRVTGAVADEDGGLGSRATDLSGSAARLRRLWWYFSR